MDGGLYFDLLPSVAFIAVVAAVGMNLSPYTIDWRAVPWSFLALFPTASRDCRRHRGPECRRSAKLGPHAAGGGVLRRFADGSPLGDFR